MGEHVERVRESLDAIEAEQVEVPSMPVDSFLLEAADLEELSARAKERAGLLEVGIDETQFSALKLAILALREAEAEWTVAKDTLKSEAQRAREKDAYNLRRRLLRACRFNFLKNRLALGAVNTIAEGEGIADLIQDLHGLAELIRTNSAAFERDNTMNAAQAREDALRLGGELDAGRKGEKFSGDKVAVKDTRDRAFTHLADIVTELREAGRYRFAEERATARGFVSEYNRRRRATSTKLAVAEPAGNG